MQSQFLHRYLQQIVGKTVSHLIGNDTQGVTCLAVYHQGIYIAARLYGILYMECGEAVQNVLRLGLRLYTFWSAPRGLCLLVTTTQHEREH